MKENEPTRCWYRFSLRTMLMVVTVVCVICGYLTWAMGWKRQREAVLEDVDTWSIRYDPEQTIVNYGGQSPYSLRLFGAVGVKKLSLAASLSDKELESASSLFPEAVVIRKKDMFSFLKSAPTSSPLP